MNISNSVTCKPCQTTKELILEGKTNNHDCLICEQTWKWEGTRRHKWDNFGEQSPTDPGVRRQMCHHRWHRHWGDWEESQGEEAVLGGLGTARMVQRWWGGLWKWQGAVGNGRENRREQACLLQQSLLIIRNFGTDGPPFTHSSWGYGRCLPSWFS